MTKNDRDQSRGGSPSEGNTHRTPTAMEEPAGSELPPLPWATGEHSGNVTDVNGYEVAEFVDGAVQDRVIAIVNAHEELVAALKELHARAIDDGCCDLEACGCKWSVVIVRAEAILAKVRA
jgi:hypothetical protein